MDRSKIYYLLGGALILVLAGVLGTALWIKVGPRPRPQGQVVRPLEGLADFGAVPQFSFTERSGKEIRLADLRGKVWLVDFMYTSCTDTCPLQSAEMARIQSDLKDQANLKLVSITVDPERDTPEVLSNYADRFKADPERWLFLTGDREKIYDLVQKGFRLSAVPAEGENEANGVILHSSRFIMVDGSGHIRGYYNSDDPEALGRLRGDLRTLLGKDQRYS
jgi:protein SCO1/2